MAGSKKLRDCVRLASSVVRRQALRCLSAGAVGFAAAGSAVASPTYPWIGAWCGTDGRLALTLTDGQLITTEEAGCRFDGIEALAVGNAWQIASTCFFDSGEGQQSILLLIVDASPAHDQPPRLVVNWVGGFYRPVELFEKC